MQRIRLLLVCVFALTAMVTAAPVTFTYTANIAIPGTGTSGPAAAYPIPIGVFGLAPDFYLVQFTISGLSHTFSDDLDFALQSPSGTIIHLMDLAGGGDNHVNSTLTFNAFGTVIPNSSLLTGVVAPSVYGSWSGGVISPTTTNMSDFTSETGATNHGTWFFYAYDQFSLDSGEFAQIQLYFDNTNPVPEPGTYALMGLGLTGVALLSRRRKA